MRTPSTSEQTASGSHRLDCTTEQRGPELIIHLRMVERITEESRALCRQACLRAGVDPELHNAIHCALRDMNILSKNPSLAPHELKTLFFKILRRQNLPMSQVKELFVLCKEGSQPGYYMQRDEQGGLRLTFAYSIGA